MSGREVHQFMTSVASGSPPSLDLIEANKKLALKQGCYCCGHSSSDSPEGKKLKGTAAKNAQYVFCDAERSVNKPHAYVWCHPTCVPNAADTAVAPDHSQTPFCVMCIEAGTEPAPLKPPSVPAGTAMEPTGKQPRTKRALSASAISPPPPPVVPFMAPPVDQRPTLSARLQGKIRRLMLLRSRNLAKLAAWAFELFRGFGDDGLSEAERLKKERTAFGNLRSDMMKKLIELYKKNKFSYSSKYLAEDTGKMQQMQLDLPEGILLKELPWIPEAGMAFAIVADQLVPGVELRLRLVAQIALHLEKPAAAGPSPVGAERTTVFERLEYLTPTGTTQIGALAKLVEGLSPDLVAALAAL